MRPHAVPVRPGQPALRAPRLGVAHPTGVAGPVAAAGSPAVPRAPCARRPSDTCRADPGRPRLGLAAGPLRSPRVAGPAHRSADGPATRSPTVGYAQAQPAPSPRRSGWTSSGSRVGSPSPSWSPSSSVLPAAGWRPARSSPPRPTPPPLRRWPSPAARGHRPLQGSSGSSSGSSGSGSGSSSGSSNGSSTQLSSWTRSAPRSTSASSTSRAA